MNDLLLPLPNSPLPRRRGRPPGARNRRSLDLARYLEATYGGMTPGQQAAAVAMVTPGEVRRARAEARELGIVAIGLPDLVLAQMVKAAKLGKALRCDTRDAWLMMQHGLEQLLPYVHQKQATAPASSGSSQIPVAYILQEPAPGAPEATPVMIGALEDEAAADLDFAGDFGAPADEVGRPKSDDDP